MNEDKIRAEFEKEFRNRGYSIKRQESGYIYENPETEFAHRGYQAALATRPDINQELVEALDELVGLKRYKDANGKDEYYRKYQPLTWEKARQALAKHKAGDVCITEEELRDRLISSVSLHTGWEESSVNMVDNCIFPALKAVGALRLKGK